MNAIDTIIYLKETLLCYLEELKELHSKHDDLFAYGEKTAYTECLEILQLWDNAAQHGLDFEIEKRYPL